jgi:SRSO17 transposase
MLPLASLGKCLRICASTSICHSPVRGFFTLLLLFYLSESDRRGIVSIRSNHGVWLPATAKVKANKWYQFPRIFSDGTTEIRYSREIIYGKRRAITYWEITTDPETLPENSTSFVMTNLQGKIQKTIGNFYGGRTWVEYGFRQVKQALGWTDYRFTKFEQIEKWWELIFSAYLMVSC